MIPRHTWQSASLLAAIAFPACSAAPDESTTLRSESEQEFGTNRSAATSAKRYGSWCQPGAYQANLLNVPPVWIGETGCEENIEFHNSFGVTRHHYFDLTGGMKYNWETNDNSYIEQVDLVFFTGHGGWWSSSQIPGLFGSNYATYYDGGADHNQLVWTRNMQIGNATTSQRGASILAGIACMTLSNDVWTEYGKSYRAGLRMVLGSHEFYSITRTGSMGKTFGAKLKAGETFRNAWYAALASTTSDNDIAVSASGTSSTNCWDRLSSMTWGNFDTKTRLTGNNAAWWCRETWDNK